jgi:hypothetical protein
LTSSERDGLMVLVIGAFALIIALLVVGFGWYAGQSIRVDEAVIPISTPNGATPLPVRPQDPTATPRGGGGNPPSVPSGTTPIPPDFPSATPDGYPGPIRGTPVPLETTTPAPTFDPTGEQPTPTLEGEPTATIIGGTTPVPLPSVSATTRVSPTATRPGSTPVATATPDPTAQPPNATPTTGGYPPPATPGATPTPIPY